MKMNEKEIIEFLEFNILSCKNYKDCQMCKIKNNLENFIKFLKESDDTNVREER